LRDDNKVVHLGQEAEQGDAASEDEGGRGVEFREGGTDLRGGSGGGLGCDEGPELAEHLGVFQGKIEAIYDRRLTRGIAAYHVLIARDASLE
jgi:hypothetical protein